MCMYVYTYLILVKGVYDVMGGVRQSYRRWAFVPRRGAS